MQAVPKSDRLDANKAKPGLVKTFGTRKLVKTDNKPIRFQIRSKRPNLVQYSDDDSDNMMTNSTSDSDGKKSKLLSNSENKPSPALRQPLVLYGSDSENEKATGETVQSQQSVEGVRNKKSVDTVRNQQSVEIVRNQKSVDTVRNRRSVETVRNQQSVETVQNQKSVRNQQSPKFVDQEKSENSKISDNFHEKKKSSSFEKSSTKNYDSLDQKHAEDSQREFEKHSSSLARRERSRRKYDHKDDRRSCSPKLDSRKSPSRYSSNRNENVSNPLDNDEESSHRQSNKSQFHENYNKLMNKQSSDFREISKKLKDNRKEAYREEESRGLSKHSKSISVSPRPEALKRGRDFHKGCEISPSRLSSDRYENFSRTESTRFSHDNVRHSRNKSSPHDDYEIEETKYSSQNIYYPQSERGCTSSEIEIKYRGQKHGRLLSDESYSCVEESYLKDRILETKNSYDERSYHRNRSSHLDDFNDRKYSKNDIAVPEHDRIWCEKKLGKHFEIEQDESWYFKSKFDQKDSSSDDRYVRKFADSRTANELKTIENENYKHRSDENDHYKHHRSDENDHYKHHRSDENDHYKHHRSDEGDHYKPHRSDESDLYKPHRSDKNDQYKSHRSEEKDQYKSHRSEENDPYKSHRSNENDQYKSHRSEENDQYEHHRSNEYNDEDLNAHKSLKERKKSSHDSIRLKEPSTNTAEVSIEKLKRQKSSEIEKFQKRSSFDTRSCDTDKEEKKSSICQTEDVEAVGYSDHNQCDVKNKNSSSPKISDNTNRKKSFSVVSSNIVNVKLDDKWKQDKKDYSFSKSDSRHVEDFSKDYKSCKEIKSKEYNNDARKSEKDEKSIHLHRSARNDKYDEDIPALLKDSSKDVKIFNERTSQECKKIHDNENCRSENKNSSVKSNDQGNLRTNLKEDKFIDKCKKSDRNVETVKSKTEREIKNMSVEATRISSKSSSKSSTTNSSSSCSSSSDSNSDSDSSSCTGSSEISLERDFSKKKLPGKQHKISKDGKELVGSKLQLSDDTDITANNSISCSTMDTKLKSMPIHVKHDDQQEVRSKALESNRDKSSKQCNDSSTDDKKKIGLLPRVLTKGLKNSSDKMALAPKTEILSTTLHEKSVLSSCDLSTIPSPKLIGKKALKVIEIEKSTELQFQDNKIEVPMKLKEKMTVDQAESKSVVTLEKEERQNQVDATLSCRSEKSYTKLCSDVKSKESNITKENRSKDRNITKLPIEIIEIDAPIESIERKITDRMGSKSEGLKLENGKQHTNQVDVSRSCRTERSDPKLCSEMKSTECNKIKESGSKEIKMTEPLENNKINVPVELIEEKIINSQSAELEPHTNELDASLPSKSEKSETKLCFVVKSSTRIRLKENKSKDVKITKSSEENAKIDVLVGTKLPIENNKIGVLIGSIERKKADVIESKSEILEKDKLHTSHVDTSLPYKSEKNDPKLSSEVKSTESNKIKEIRGNDESITKLQFENNKNDVPTELTEKKNADTIESKSELKLENGKQLTNQVEATSSCISEKSDTKLCSDIKYTERNKTKESRDRDKEVSRDYNRHSRRHRSRSKNREMSKSPSSHRKDRERKSRSRHRRSRSRTRERRRRSRNRNESPGYYYRERSSRRSRSGSRRRRSKTPSRRSRHSSRHRYERAKERDFYEKDLESSNHSPYRRRKRSRSCSNHKRYERSNQKYDESNKSKDRSNDCVSTGVDSIPLPDVMSATITSSANILESESVGHSAMPSCVRRTDDVEIISVNKISERNEQLNIENVDMELDDSDDQKECNSISVADSSVPDSHVDGLNSMKQQESSFKIFNIKPIGKIAFSMKDTLRNKSLQNVKQSIFKEDSDEGSDNEGSSRKTMLGKPKVVTKSTSLSSLINVPIDTTYSKLHLSSSNSELVDSTIKLASSSSKHLETDSVLLSEATSSDFYFKPTSQERKSFHNMSSSSRQKDYDKLSGSKSSVVCISSQQKTAQPIPSIISYPIVRCTSNRIPSISRADSTGRILSSLTPDSIQYSTSFEGVQKESIHRSANIDIPISSVEVAEINIVNSTSVFKQCNSENVLLDDVQKSSSKVDYDVVSSSRRESKETNKTYSYSNTNAENLIVIKESGNVIESNYADSTQESAGKKPEEILHTLSVDEEINNLNCSSDLSEASQTNETFNSKDDINSQLSILSGELDIISNQNVVEHVLPVKEQLLLSSENCSDLSLPADFTFEENYPSDCVWEALQDSNISPTESKPLEHIMANVNAEGELSHGSVYSIERSESLLNAECFEGLEKNNSSNNSNNVEEKKVERRRSTRLKSKEERKIDQEQEGSVNGKKDKKNQRTEKKNISVSDDVDDDQKITVSNSKARILNEYESSSNNDSSGSNVTMNEDSGASYNFNFGSVSENGCNNLGDSPSSAKPEKVKSRWRRWSELESDGTERKYDTPPPPPPPPPPCDVTETNHHDESKVNDVAVSNEFDSSEKQSEVLKCDAVEAAASVEVDESSETKEIIEKEIEMPPHYIDIQESIFLSERDFKKQRKEARRMICDCTLPSSDDMKRGISPCGDDCLNRMLMIECGSRCPCGEFCTNKLFTKHQYAAARSFKTDYKGWGLQAAQDMPPGTFIMEYIGEVLDYKEFKARTKKYAKENAVHHYFMALNGDEVIDATKMGNISRFINHSCDPNAETQKWTVNGQLRIGFFTIKPVKTGEELTFNYQFESYGREKMKCFCGASNCKGTIGSTKRSPLKRRGKLKSKDIRKKLQLFSDLFLEEEIDQILQLGGLRRKDHVLELNRLMLRADCTEHRLSLLKVLEDTKELVCLRLFLEYQGLPILWSWMVDVSNDALDFKKQILKILNVLPINNITMLKNSRVLSVVEKWSKEAASETSKDQDTECKENKVEAATTGDSKNKTNDEQEDSNVTKPETVENIADKEEDAVIKNSDSSSSNANEATNANNNGNIEQQKSFPHKKRKMLMQLHHNESGSSSDGEPSDSIKTEDVESQIDEDFSEADAQSDAAATADTVLKANVEQVGNGDQAGRSNISDMASDLISRWKDLKEIYKIPKIMVEERKKTEQELDRRYEEETHKNKDSYRGWEKGKRQVDESPEFRYGIKRRKTTEDRELEDTVRTHRPRIMNRVLQPIPPSTLSKQERRQQFEAQVKAKEEMQKQEMIQQQQQQQQQPDSTYHDYYTSDQSSYSIGTPAPYQESSQTLYQDAYPDPAIAYQDPLNLQYSNEGYYDDINPSIYQTQELIPTHQPIAALDPLSYQPQQITLSYRDQQALPIETLSYGPQASVVIETGHYPEMMSDVSGYISGQPYMDPSQASSLLYTTQQYAQVMAPVAGQQPVYYSTPQGSIIVQQPIGQTIYPSPAPLPSSYIQLVPDQSTLRNLKIKQLTEELELTRKQGPCDPRDPPPPPPSPPKPKNIRLPPNWKIAKDQSGKIYYYHSVTRQTQWDPPAWDSGTNDDDVDDDDDEDSDNMDLGTPTNDEAKHKHRRRTTTAAADTSSEKKIKDQFRSKIAKSIITYLGPYRKSDCEQGRITNTDDFKKLARKLTHTVLNKELKHCRHLEDLEVNENVKGKAKDFVAKYMSRFGALYKPSASSP